MSLTDQTTLRPATRTDLSDLKDIYIDAVQTLGPLAYSAEAVAAWQRWPNDSPDEFRQRVLAGHTWVAEVNGTAAAFAEFTAPDHLDFLYTKGAFARRGLATRLHQHLERIALSEGATFLRTEASYLSRPAFAKFGYEVFAFEIVERFGEKFRRFKMRKFLRPGPAATAELLPCRTAYEAAFANPPRVAVDETVQYFGADPKHPGWFKGQTKAGCEGYFPIAWFEVNEATGEATAQRDYDAHELTVEAGARVGVIESEPGWVRVMTEGGEIGWVPVETAPVLP